MIDILLLAKLATLRLLHRYPQDIKEAIGIFGACIGVLKLWEAFETIPPDRVGTETTSKQILAEYLKEIYLRKQANQ